MASTSKKVKLYMKTTVTLLILFALLLLNACDQDYTQWSLPTVAKARLGKGRVTGNSTYSPDGTRLAVGGSIGIWLYDMATYKEVLLLTGHTGWVRSVTFSPDGKTLASGSDDETVRLWDAATGEQKHALIGHTGEVNSISFSPDGKTLASGSWDGTILLWKISP